DLRDAEVEQLRLTRRGHEDVRRLQVAMDDEVAVRVLDGVANPAEQLDAPPHRNSHALAVRRDGFPVDVLHREVGTAVDVRAAVEEARDEGMFEPREDLTFAPEAREHRGIARAGPHDLQGDTLLELAVGALRLVDDAHAAAPDLADDPVG